MARNYTKEEIEDLIFDLSSDDDEIAEFAMAALMIANPRRHLSDLINALREYDDDIVKQRICYLLGSFTDKRCIAPLLSTLEDKNIDTRISAIDSLQYFPEEYIIPFLQQQLKSESPELREAVITTLGTFVKQGVPGAHLPLIEVIQKEEEELELRHLALINIEYLEEEQLMPILDELKNISNASIYFKIQMLKDELGTNKKQKIEEIETLINKLTTEKDILNKIKIEKQLLEFGGLTAELLIKHLFEDVENIDLIIHARLILEKLGKKIITSFKALFESFNQFDDIKRIILLTDLVDFVAHRKYANLKPSLLKLLHEINLHIKENSEEIELNALLDQLKIEIHYALAKYGSRNAIDDLQEMIKDGTTRLYVTAISALTLIGDKRFLIPLLNQYRAYENVETVQSTIKKAVKAIMKREKIDRNDKMFENLSQSQQQALNKILIN